MSKRQRIFEHGISILEAGHEAHDYGERGTLRQWWRWHYGNLLLRIGSVK